VRSGEGGVGFYRQGTVTSGRVGGVWGQWSGAREALANGRAEGDVGAVHCCCRHAAGVSRGGQARGKREEIERGKFSARSCCVSVRLVAVPFFSFWARWPGVILERERGSRLGPWDRARRGAWVGVQKRGGPATKFGWNF
jgi:hypothetical protein